MKIVSYILMAFFTLSFMACGSSKKVNYTKIIKKTYRDTVFVEKSKTKENNQVVSAVLQNYVVKDAYFPAKSQDFRQKFLILHYTALSREKSYQVLTQQAVSAHYLVDDVDNQDIDILVSEDRRAWHAGVSYWNGRTNVNDSSIGIEIVNPGYSVVNNKKIFYPYPEHQFKKVAALAQNIVARYHIDPTYVLGHSDIAPQRKEDPGAFFPWKRLYEEYQVGAWYDEVDKYNFMARFPSNQINTRTFILSYQKDLATYGYEVTQDGVWGTQMENLTAAFQLHFRPSRYDGVLDAETWAILKALNKKYKN